MRTPTLAGASTRRARATALCGCCHVKAFNVSAGILEIFTICFLIVAILPDLNSKICLPSTEDLQIEELLRNETLSGPPKVPGLFLLNHSNTTVDTPFDLGVATVRRIICTIGFGWFALAFLHIIKLRPIALVTTFIVIIVVGLFKQGADGEDKFTLSLVMGAAVFILAILLFLTAVLIRCCQFVKKSAATGYSVSHARPMGPPTISLSNERNVGGAVHQPPHQRALSPPAVDAQLMKLDEEGPALTLPPLNTLDGGSNLIQTTTTAVRRQSAAFSHTPLGLQQLPPLRTTYRPGGEYSTL
ncbi:hypothetical protein M3Y99_00054100 [Aphelenchoides fujianensis]|nr:hypothetical protein M3Y99_00054100 [Aphelenchoides fujianensis]